ncbi:MAG TPA: hemerythrin domain-containing protein [Gaiellaceae bacterium]|nr:hemerythrin domain-containing protein [Gaiellaceae bacterium]
MDQERIGDALRRSAGCGSGVLDRRARRSRDLAWCRGRRSELKRHPALIPLSHDHHAELVQARRLRLASGSDVAEARVAAAQLYVAAFFTESASHFRVEEEQLFPLLTRDGGSSPLLEQVLSEHQELRRLAATLREEAAAGAASGATMLQLADLLESNARREERELFPLIERTVPDAELRALDLRSSVTAMSGG